MLGNFLAKLDRRFGIAAVYGVFVLLSLVVAVVLFGFLQSSGVLGLVLDGFVKQAEFGGAFAGFFATLILLLRNYSSLVDAGRYHLTGTVYFKDDFPAGGAMVFVEGWNSVGTANAVGHFQIEVRDQREWTVGAHLGNAKAAAAVVSRQNVETPIKLILDKTKSQLRTNELPSPELTRHKVRKEKD